MKGPPEGQLLDNAFAAASRNGHSSGAIHVGTLNSMISLVPNLFRARESLRTLGLLSTSKKKNEIEHFNLQVQFGVGDAFHTELYKFMNSVLHFQSPEGFDECLSNGFSFHITGGYDNHIIAGVTFTVAEDGVFIDALAVSTGTGPDVSKLCIEQFGDTHSLRKLIHFQRKKRVGSFQGLGLGHLLMRLVERCARKWCTVAEAAIVLKMNNACTAFYRANGYASSSSQLSLPAGLLAKVPASNYRTAPPETLLMFKPALNKVSDPGKPKAKAPKVPRKKDIPKANPSRVLDESVLSTHPPKKKSAAKSVKKPPLTLRSLPGAGTSGPSISEPDPSFADDESDGGAAASKQVPSEDDELGKAPTVNPSKKKGSRTKPTEQIDSRTKKISSKAVTAAAKRKVRPAASRTSKRKLDLIDDDLAEDIKRRSIAILQDGEPSDETAKSLKKKLSQRKKKELVREKKMETCVIDDSDQSESEYDFPKPEIQIEKTPNQSKKLRIQTEPDPEFVLPVADVWEPQDPANEKFRASATSPEAMHGLTQKEVYAKYPMSENRRLALGRIKVLKQGLVFEENNQAYQERHNGWDLFAANRKDESARNPDKEVVLATPDEQSQLYVDYACVSDPNRPLSFDTFSHEEDEQTVQVFVSSYTIPKKTSLKALLDNRTKRRQLRRDVRKVLVNLDWLASTCRPEMWKVVEEKALGTQVLVVGGHHVATSDKLALSFSGVSERVKGYQSVPQGQRQVFIRVKPPEPLNPEEEPNMSNILYDSKQNATELMRKIMRDLHSSYNLRQVPPPPKSTTQIVKLQWVPSQNPNRKESDDGVWHGCFAIHLGKLQSNTQMQQCSLTAEWVESAFSRAFLKECRAVATKAAGYNQSTAKHLFIPAGDSRNPGDDHPAPDLLLLDKQVQYLQGDLDSCLRDSMASAFHAMGFVDEAEVLAKAKSLSRPTVNLISLASQLVRTVFKRAGLVLKKVAKECSVDHVAFRDFSWPMVMTLRTDDGLCGSHAITVWNGLIYDSNFPHPLHWCQRSLDWCSGQGSTCLGFFKVYRLVPEFDTFNEEGNVRLGMQVKTCSVSSSVLGWVARLPNKHRKEYTVRFTDGNNVQMSLEDVMKFRK